MYIRTIVLQRVANYLHVLVNMISLAVRFFEFHGHWGGGGISLRQPVQYNWDR